MTATTAIIDTLTAVPWSTAGIALGFVLGLALGLARGARLRATLYGLCKDPTEDHLSHTKLMVMAGAGSVIFAFNRAVITKPDLISVDLMLGVGGTILLLAGSSAGSKYLASKSGVRVDQGNGIG